MHAAGVKLVISSDQGSTSTRIDELALLMDFLVNKVHLPPMHVLYGVTGLAAEALGIEADVGTLAPGKLADLILVDGDPSTDMAALRRIHMVVKEGAVAVRDGALM
jgi:imidazolonepropionase-like amidohydrolase